MTPEDKAFQIYNYMLMSIDGLGKYPMCHDTAKQCAIVAVNEVMQTLSLIDYGIDYLSKMDYWEAVKQEIEKL